MKNYQYIQLVAIIAIMIAPLSCADDFLDKSDPTRLGAKDFYATKIEINQALTGTYSNLQVIVGDRGQWLYNELISDNTTLDLNASDRGQSDRQEAIEYWTFNAANVFILDMYRSLYSAIFQINNTLIKLEASTVVTEVERTVIVGQLKFQRAYLYFQLTQYFGDVIIITSPVGDDPTLAWTYARKPQTEVYMQIENDLKDAIKAELPVKWDAINVGRVTKGAAISLLGKVYLTQKKYADAATTLKLVLDLGYDLVRPYADVFDPAKKNGIESIFDIQYQGATDVGEWSSFIYTFGPRDSKGAVTGWPKSNPGGWNMPTNDVIAAYEPGDTRKEASIGFDYVRPETGKVIAYIKKYAHPHTVEGRTDDNWPVLRYADVLLMLAEAINETEGPDNAYLYINLVRDRAGLNPLSGLNKDSFRDKVLKERRVELAFENWRWFDLKRTHTPSELKALMNAHGAQERANPTVDRKGVPWANNDYIFEEYMMVLPIPAEELRINKNLIQNDKY